MFYRGLVFTIMESLFEAITCCFLGSFCGLDEKNWV